MANPFIDLVKNDIKKEDRIKAENGNNVSNIHDYRFGPTPNVNNPKGESIDINDYRRNNIINDSQFKEFLPDPLVSLDSDFQNEHQSSIDIIDGDSIFEGDIKPAEYSKVGDEMYPKDNATHNYSVYNSDQELTPDRVTEFAKETEKNSIAPGKEREYKKQRRKTVMKTLGALLAAAAAVASIYVGIKATADNNSKEDLDNAERVYNATHKYVQMLNEKGIDTPEEYSDHIDHFEGKAQLDELSKIAIGEMETPFEEIENPKDIINDKEVIENMDEIKEENNADGGNLRQEMFKANGGDEAMGSWRDSSYNRVVKSLVRK